MPGAVVILEVKVSTDPESVDVVHHGRDVTIMRDHDQNDSIDPDVARTSRICPPFCIRPIELAPGVKTVGALEALHYLKQASDGDASVLAIGSRTPARAEKGIIPGTVNIPWDTRHIGNSDRAARKPA